MTPPISALFWINVQFCELNLTDSSRKNTPPSYAVFPSNMLLEKNVYELNPDRRMLPLPLDVLFWNLQSLTFMFPPLFKVIRLS